MYYLNPLFSILFILLVLVAPGRAQETCGKHFLQLSWPIPGPLETLSEVQSLIHENYRFTAVRGPDRLFFVVEKDGTYWKHQSIPEAILDNKNLKIILNEKFGIPSIVGRIPLRNIPRHVQENGYINGFLGLFNKQPSLLTLPRMIIDTRPRVPVSYNEVLDAMKENPYDLENLEHIPVRMWSFVRNRILGSFIPGFIVGQRSIEIMQVTDDYSVLPEAKPIHPMGIGMEGVIRTQPTKYSGIFRGGEFLVLSRFSISQDNVGLYWRDIFGRYHRQQRSVALAIKVFDTMDKDKKVVTGNSVFQNDLNGEVIDHYVDGVMTNQPQLSFSAMFKNIGLSGRTYEFFTLIGVAMGSFSNPQDQRSASDDDQDSNPINPQIRPIHQLTELGEEHPSQVKTPKWIKIQHRSTGEVIHEGDFRLELSLYIDANGSLIYDIFLGDELDEEGEIIWDYAGEMEYTDWILSEGVDKKYRSLHSALRSRFTGEIINPSTVPKPVRVDDSLDRQ